MTLPQPSGDNSVAPKMNFGGKPLLSGHPALGCIAAGGSRSYSLNPSRSQNTKPARPSAPVLTSKRT